MSPTIKRLSYQEKLEILQEMKGWLNDLGIDCSSSRFSEVLEVIKKLTYAYETNAIDSLIDEYGDLVLQQALVDGNSFREIYEAFKKEKSDAVPRGKLKKMIQGPLLPWDEDPKADNIESRNTLFELEMVALLKNAGAKIIGFDDVDFQFRGKTFNMQCKRIHSVKKVVDNLKSAASQAKSRTERRGLLCICIDKLMGKEQMILRVRNAKDIGPPMEKLVLDFNNEYQNEWINISDTNISGVFIVAHGVALLLEEKPKSLLVTTRQLLSNVNKTCREADCESTLKLAESLKLAIDS